MVEKRLFDPWGAVTQVQDGAGNNLGVLTFFDRGYTGHEHLQGVNLINMNARLYNPTLHRFLEADNYLQDPYNTQNYNRYGYCVNNPLKYTDVTGNVFNIATVAGCIPVIGSAFASLLMHQTVHWEQVAQDFVITAISAGVTFGIGEACSTIVNFYTRMAVSALAHGVFQGGMTAATGGKFWAGFAAGAVSSIASSFWQGGQEEGFFKENDYAYGVRNVHEGLGSIFGMNNAFGTIAFGTIMGAAGSRLAGGTFWQGAVTGMIVSTFNDVMHQKPKPKRYKVINNTSEAKDHYYNGKGEPAIIGKESTNELRNSSEYKWVMNRLSNGSAINLNGSFDVNMTYDTFHIGHTNVDYTTTCTSGNCITTFKEFVRDGFYDPDFLNEPSGITNPLHHPDGMGPNLEFGGGSPYMYVPSTHVYIYKNPGYKF